MLDRMGDPAAISLEQYVRSSFPNPDPEFRDGQIVYRSIPDYLHGKVQGLVVLVLIPDVTVFYPDEPEAQPQTPPLIAIEILSPEDRLSAVREKLEEYRAWGVPHVWLIDPHSRRLYSCESGFAEVKKLRVPELDIELEPADCFDWKQPRLTRLPVREPSRT